MDTPVTHGADLALQACLEDWFALCRQERLGALPGHAECVRVLRAIRQAEKLSSAPRLVYEVTAGRWWTTYGEAP